MTRAKEVDPDSGDMPDYKSPANRLVHSLRKGYDNLRSKLKTLRGRIKYYQIKTRDIEKSRELYKKQTIDLQNKINQLEKENERLKKQNDEHPVKKKKRS